MVTKSKPQLSAKQQEAFNRDLLLAARDGNFDGVVAALEDGADVHARYGDQGLNAFHFAALRGDLKTASYLLKRGADIEAESHDGDRALHLAALANKPRMVEFLLANHANVDAQNQDGLTALHRAVQGQGELVVRAVLDAGVDPTLKGDTLFGHATALELAADRVKEVAGTNGAETAHAITHRIFRYEMSLKQPLPEVFTKTNLTYEDHETVAPLDQPRVWGRFREIMDQMKQTPEGALTKADLMKYSSVRARWLQRGIECHAADAVLEHLRENGEYLTADDLVTTRGEPTPILKFFIDNEEVGSLMKAENWYDEGLAGFRRVLNALPEDSRDTLQNVHSTQAALQRAERQAGSGRGA